jgi:hypothetical protein
MIRKTYSKAICTIRRKNAGSMLMWIDVTVPQKKLPSGQHWMILQPSQFVCSVFRLDHHSAVQFLLRFLVHPKAEIFISIRFCPVVFNEMLYTPKALLFNFKKTDKCMSVHWFVRILFRCHQFSLELCLDFVWRTLGLFVFYLWFQWNLLSKLPIKWCHVTSSNQLPPLSLIYLPLAISFEIEKSHST